MNLLWRKSIRSQFKFKGYAFTTTGQNSTPLMRRSARDVGHSRKLERRRGLMDYSDLKRLRQSGSSEETASEKTPDKRKGAALRVKLKHIDDLNRQYPERLWVTLLRMHFRPVVPVRLNPETTETLRTRNGEGDEVWQVGSEFMTKDEAIYKAEKLRRSKTPPVWGTIDGRFGDSFLDVYEE